MNEIGKSPETKTTVEYDDGYVEEDQFITTNTPLQKYPFLLQKHRCKDTVELTVHPPPPQPEVTTISFMSGVG